MSYCEIKLKILRSLWTTNEMVLEMILKQKEAIFVSIKFWKEEWDPHLIVWYFCFQKFIIFIIKYLVEGYSPQTGGLGPPSSKKESKKILLLLSSAYVYIQP